MRYLRWSRVVPKEGRHVMLALQTQDSLPLLVSPYAIVASVQLFRVSHLPDNSRPPGPPRTSKLGKAGGRSKKDITPTGCLSEKLSMFFSNSIANKKGFLPRPAPFRGWTLGAGREAGSWQQDAIRNILGQLGSIWSYKNTLPGGTGALSWTTSGEGGFAASSEITMQGVTFDASCVVPTAEEDRPVNVALPVILYLGLPA